VPADYPWPQVRAPNDLHLFDFVARRLTGGMRVLGCHLLDQARRWPFLRVITTKNSLTVMQFLVAAWQEIGLPFALYLDNDVVWRGSSLGQRTISRIIRLCLLCGVEVVFTPTYSPEANPLIESFNSVWDRNFWQRSQFEHLEQMRRELTYFESYCRTRRQLTEADRQTPEQLFPNFQPVCLPLDFTAHETGHLPLTAGKVHFIRFVTEEGIFNLLNENWQLEPEQWAGKTIRATLDTQTQRLAVYHLEPDHRCRLIQEFAYLLREALCRSLRNLTGLTVQLFGTQPIRRAGRCPRCLASLFACKSAVLMSTMCCESPPVLHSRS
jgi:hypothetical protein